MRLALVMCAAAVACNGSSTSKTEAQPPAPRPFDAAPAQPVTKLDAMTEPSLEWKSYKLGETGLSADVLTDADVQYTELGGTETWLQNREPITMSVHLGADVTLADWKKRLTSGLGGNPDAEFSQPESVTLCGRKAARQVARVPAGRPLEVSTGSGYERRQTPATTHVAVALMYDKKPLLVAWSVHTEHRDAYRDAEKHFFDSITCPST